MAQPRLRRGFVRSKALASVSASSLRRYSDRLLGPLGLGLCWLGLSVLAGCGGPEKSVDDWLRDLRAADADVSNRAAEALGAMGRKDPAVLARLIRDLQQDREEPEVSALRFRADRTGLDPAEREALTPEIARVLSNRLAAMGVPTMVVDSLPGGVYLVRLRRPPADRDETTYLREVIEGLERLGSLEVLAVVPRPGASVEGAPAWEGDAAAYDAFVAEESKRWMEAKSTGARYVSSRPGRRVAPQVGPATEGPGWIVVADAEPGKRFDEKVLTAVADVAPSRPALLLVQVAAERQDAFEAWTGSLVGREVALVVDGRSEAVARLDAPARDHLAFPMGPGRANDDRARRIVRGTVGGRLRVPIHGEVVPPAPAPGGPIARALVAVGPPADDPLAQLERDEGPASAAARWAREEILKQRTRGGR